MRRGVVLGVMAFVGWILPGAPVHAQAEEPRPPFEAPTIVISVSWPFRDDLQFSYYATTSPEPLADPFGPGTFASWAGGCGPGALVADNGASLALSPAPSGRGYNWAGEPGTYTVVVQSSGWCAYTAAGGGLDEARLEATVAAHPEGSMVDVTVLVSSYAAGEEVPALVESFTVAAPVHSNEGDPSLRRMVTTVEVPALPSDPSLAGSGDSPSEGSVAPADDAAGDNGAVVVDVDDVNQNDRLALLIAAVLVIAVVMVGLVLGRGALMDLLRSLLEGFRGRQVAAPPARTLPPPRPGTATAASSAAPSDPRSTLIRDADGVPRLPVNSEQRRRIDDAFDGVRRSRGWTLLDEYDAIVAAKPPVSTWEPAAIGSVSVTDLEPLSLDERRAVREWENWLHSHLRRMRSGSDDRPSSATPGAPVQPGAEPDPAITEHPAASRVPLDDQGIPMEISVTRLAERAFYDGACERVRLDRGQSRYEEFRELQRRAPSYVPRSWTGFAGSLQPAEFAALPTPQQVEYRLWRNQLDSTRRRCFPERRPDIPLESISDRQFMASGSRA